MLHCYTNFEAFPPTWKSAFNSSTARSQLVSCVRPKSSRSSDHHLKFDVFGLTEFGMIRDDHIEVGKGRKRFVWKK